MRTRQLDILASFARENMEIATKALCALTVFSYIILDNASEKPPSFLRNSLVLPSEYSTIRSSSRFYESPNLFDDLKDS